VSQPKVIIFAHDIGVILFGGHFGSWVALKKRAGWLPINIYITHITHRPIQKHIKHTQK